MTQYQFDIEEAKQLGVDGAIIVQNLRFWILKNQANGKHFHENRTWTYNSLEAFCTLFPFWSKRQIERILKKLVEQGIVLKSNFNQVKYDRTSWYAFEDEERFLKPAKNPTKADSTKRGNGTHDSGASKHASRDIDPAQTGTPIPDENPDQKTDGSDAPPIREAYFVDLCQRERKGDVLDSDEKACIEAYRDWQKAQLKRPDVTNGFDTETAIDPAFQPVFDQLVTAIGADVTTSWFGKTELLGKTGNRITLRVPTKFIREWIVQRHTQHLLSALRAIFGPDTVFQIQVKSKAPSPAEGGRVTESKQSAATTEQPA